MKQTRKTKLNRALLALVMALTYGFMTGAQVEAGERPQLGPGQTNWDPADDGGSRASIATTDLNLITPQAMVDALMAPLPAGVTATVTAFSGVNIAGGTFVGGGVGVIPNVLSGPVGFPHGAILSSGDIASVRGAVYPGVNTSPCITTNNGEPGDVDLNNLGGTFCTSLPTRDRAALEFDIVSTGVNRELVFKYVFASEEYNEWVGTQWNDACAIFVSGPGVVTGAKPFNEENRARFPGCRNYRVCVNSINNGRNSGYYQDNTIWVGGPPPVGPPRDTEMDGLTNWNQVMYSWPVTLLAGQTYHVKLVVADTRDRICDANLFAKGYVEESSGLGSCRIPGDTCICIDDVLEADCIALGGTWDVGMVCGELPCGDLTGACCDLSGGCADSLLLTECYASGGVYAGDNTTCGSVVGACCSADLTCVETTEECCGLLADGGFWIAGTCASADCIPTGNCCVEGECMEDVTEAVCNSAGGEYQGNGTECVPSACAGGGHDHDPIPTVSEWGLVVMTLLVLTAGTVVIGRRRRAAAA